MTRRFMRRVTLIGMPGSGKSAVGKIIASRLGCKFIDTDKCIEERNGMSLQALIDAVGEEPFIRLEEETILNLAIAEPAVISTGGSVVYSDAAMRRLAALSTVVFLDVTIDAMRAHIESEAPRGIIGMAAGGLEELFQQRRPLYRRYASVTVSFGTETPEEAATKILSALPED
jgi:shikimate kinase